MTVKLHHLRDFIAIAQAQSLRGGARALAMAQPALTRSLRELEQSVGVQLLQRHARGVLLTAEGERYLQRAKAVMEELRVAGEEARQHAGDMQGQVTVALSSAVILGSLPQAYTRYREQHPLVRLRILEGAFPMVEAGVRDGTVDFYVGPRPAQADRARFQVETCYDNQRLVMVRRGHPLARVHTLRRLAQADWLLTGVLGRYEGELAEQFQALGLAPPRTMTRVESMLGVLTLLASTDAVAVLPRQVAESRMFAPVLVRVPVRESLGSPDIVLIRRSGLPLTPAAERLADLLRAPA